MPKVVRGLFVAVTAILTTTFLTGCGGTDRRHAVNPATTASPPFIELRTETHATTIHFPPGLYALQSEDNHGYYYRAPGKVYERNYYGRLPHDGGIFVSKTNQRKLRGYVMMPGGLTHVGNLSRADYQFRN